MSAWFPPFSLFSSVVSPRFCSSPLTRKPPLRSRRRLRNHAKEYSGHRDVYTPGDDSVVVPHFFRRRAVSSRNPENRVKLVPRTRDDKYDAKRYGRFTIVRTNPQIFKTKTSLSLQRVSSKIPRYDRSRHSRGIFRIAMKSEHDSSNWTNPKFASPGDDDRTRASGESGVLARAEIRALTRRGRSGAPIGEARTALGPPAACRVPRAAAADSTRGECRRTRKVARMILTDVSATRDTSFLSRRLG